MSSTYPATPFKLVRRRSLTSLHFRLFPFVSEPLTACRRPVPQFLFLSLGSRLFLLVQAVLSIRALLTVVELEIVAIVPGSDPIPQHGAREAPFLTHPPSRQPTRLSLTLHR